MTTPDGFVAVCAATDRAGAIVQRRTHAFDCTIEFAPASEASASRIDEAIAICASAVHVPSAELRPAFGDPHVLAADDTIRTRISFESGASADIELIIPRAYQIQSPIGAHEFRRRFERTSQDPIISIDTSVKQARLTCPAPTTIDGDVQECSGAWGSEVLRSIHAGADRMDCSVFIQPDAPQTAEAETVRAQRTRDAEALCKSMKISSYTPAQP